MAWFGKREQSFEEKFAHDEELRFKILARRNKLLGLWAAEQLGLKNEAAEKYAEDLLQFSVKNPGDDPLIKKIRTDFLVKKLRVSDHQIRRRMNELLQLAIEKVENEK